MNRKALLVWLMVLWAGAANVQAQDTLNCKKKLAAPQKQSFQYSEATLQRFERLLEQYENNSRLEWQNPDFVVRQLGDLKGKTVADIGAGSGYFTFRLARYAQKVIAVDIDYRFLEYIEDKKDELQRGVTCQIETRLGAPHDAALFEDEVDVVLLVNTYPFIQKREDYFKKLAKSIRKNGFVMIVSFKRGDMPVGPPEEFKLSASEVAKELKKAGYRVESVDDKSLQYQYIVKARL